MTSGGLNFLLSQAVTALYARIRPFTLQSRQLQRRKSVMEDHAVQEQPSIEPRWRMSLLALARVSFLYVIDLSGYNRTEKNQSMSELDWTWAQRETKPRYGTLQYARVNATMIPAQAWRRRQQSDT